ncbi:MgtC/SapB family protein [Segnochrobactraceae bacterium EtOH-i3]
MTDPDLFSRLGAALAIGLLVGLDRGWQSRDEEGRHVRAAGFRTFALIGLGGGLAGALSHVAGPIVLAAAFLGFVAVLLVFRLLQATVEQDYSATTLIAALVTFLLGAYAAVGDVAVAVAGGVSVTLLLALREPLHRWVRSLSWDELRAGLTLLAMTFLLLPVLPDRALDPWGALNPYRIWMVAIMIATISFGGYLAIRVLGEKLGVLAAALAGGLASSTATTVTLARLARLHPGSARLLSAGILIAGAVMVVRVGVVVSVLNVSLLPGLVVPLGVVALVLALSAALLMYGNTATEQPDLALSSPLDLGTALRMAALIGVILLATALARDQVGDRGVLIVASISGIADVDAITISMAQLARDSGDHRLPLQAIAIAVAVNTLAKVLMAGWIGGLRVLVCAGIGSLVAVLAGAAAVLLSVG